MDKPLCFLYFKCAIAVFASEEYCRCIFGKNILRNRTRFE